MWLPQKPTPAEYQVLVVASSLVFFVLGVTGIVSGLLASPEKRDLAHNAIRYGAASIGLSLILAAGFWLARRLTRE